MEIPELKFASMQDYILHYNSSYADKITKNKQDVIDFISEHKTANIELKKERNFYGLTDYRFILTT